MPTIHREGGFRFFFYSNEGEEPPHVHVEHEDNVAKFWLDPIRLESAGGMGKALVRRAQRIVTAREVKFRAEWDAFAARKER